jgi:hypothetical protein
MKNELQHVSSRMCNLKPLAKGSKDFCGIHKKKFFHLLLSIHTTNDVDADDNDEREGSEIAKAGAGIE